MLAKYLFKPSQMFSIKEAKIYDVTYDIAG
jgi:hypothetical protein